MLEVLQIATVLLGITTTLLSLCLAYRFYSIQHDLSTPLAFMLGAECIAGVVTVMFSINSMVHTLYGVNPDLWNTLPAEAAIAMRWILFLTVGATSIHLFKVVQNLIK